MAHCGYCGHQVSATSQAAVSHGSRWFCNNRHMMLAYGMKTPDVRDADDRFADKIMAVIVVCAVLAIAYFVIFPIKRAGAEWAGTPGPYSGWFKAQMQEPTAGEHGPTSCCGDEENAGGDGRFVDVRSLGNGQYEVFIKEFNSWLLYPKPVNPNYPNPTGKNVVWIKLWINPINQQLEINWFCLRLAQGV